ncbi:hypothetical protein [Bacillus mycoides]|uniref:hypothetical protein n=1 Tax=Bacillus mycoides TaxID=1405 RepID=UPI00159BB0D3|nr:hypothetical protein [Bacillus mycoides]MCQ6530325.1 hypothetical protein [Bacillus mycoides]
MYKKRIEELLRVMGALDELGKDYKVTKTTKHLSLPLVTYPKRTWVIEELNKDSNTHAK